MAVDLDDVEKHTFSSFLSSNPPYGTTNYDLKYLTSKQQEELNKIKVDAARKCQAYLAKNDKYIRGLIMVILRFVLRVRAKRNVPFLIGKYFRKTSPIDIEDQILQYSEQREESMVKLNYDDILKSIYQTEAMKDFLERKQARIKTIKLTRGIVEDLVDTVPQKADVIMAGRTVDDIWERAQCLMDESDKKMNRVKKVTHVMDKIINDVFKESKKAQIEEILEMLLTKVDKFDLNCGSILTTSTKETTYSTYSTILTQNRTDGSSFCETTDEIEFGKKESYFNDENEETMTINIGGLKLYLNTVGQNQFRMDGSLGFKEEYNKEEIVKAKCGYGYAEMTVETYDDENLVVYEDNDDYPEPGTTEVSLRLELSQDHHMDIVLGKGNGTFLMNYGGYTLDFGEIAKGQLKISGPEDFRADITKEGVRSFEWKHKEANGLTIKDGKIMQKPDSLGQTTTKIKVKHNRVEEIRLEKTNLIFTMIIDGLSMDLSLLVKGQLKIEGGEDMDKEIYLQVMQETKFIQNSRNYSQGFPANLIANQFGIHELPHS